MPARGEWSRAAAKASAVAGRNWNRNVYEENSIVRLTLQPRHEVARVDRHARVIDMHLVGVFALLHPRDLLDVEDIEAAAAAGGDDQRSILIVLFPPRRVLRTIITRRPGRHHHGELLRQRHHVAERADLVARFGAGQIPTGVMRMRADIGGPSGAATRVDDDFKPE